MPRLPVHAPEQLRAGFQRIRREFDVPESFPAAVLEQAARTRAPRDGRSDHRHLGFVAIDPEGATDLDQAFHGEVVEDGFLVRYAIADVGAFVAPGSPLDHEAMTRGATLYLPDGRAPLHPPIVGDDRASLRQAPERPALVWTFELDRHGQVTSARLARSLVQVAAAISYQHAQQQINQRSSPLLEVLRRVGELRLALEASRGGVSIAVPTQDVIQAGGGGYELEFERVIPVERWNAQISLMAGMEAANKMAEEGVGIVRTLPAPEQAEIGRLRLQAGLLGLHWPEDHGYAEFVRTLTGNDPASASFLRQAVRLLRGAGYEVVVQSGQVPLHGAIAAPYAHVTAPLRRLVDRFGNEILVALYAELPAPGWAVDRLGDLPSIMASVQQRQNGIDRAVVDLVETVVLERHVGERFEGHVVDLRNDHAVVQLDDHPVVVTVGRSGAPSWELAEPVELTLEHADVESRRLVFDPA